MLFLGGKEIESVFFGNKVITSIYKGATLIWEAIKSCFGSGLWKNESPWSDTEGWKN